MSNSYTRRSFMGAAGAATVAAAAWPAATRGDSRSSKRDADVVVIGAGYSGIVAARELASAGARVLLLEARDRFGGRTENQPLPGGGLLDLGAGWVSPSHSHMIRLASEFGAKLIDQDYRGETVVVEGAHRFQQPALDPQQPTAALSEAMKVFQLLDEMSKSLSIDDFWEAADAATWDNLQMSQWLSQNFPQLTPEAASIVEGVFNGYIAPTPWFSVLHGLFYGLANGGWTSPHALFLGQKRLDIGTQGLAIRIGEDAMQRGIQVRFNSPVRCLENSGSAVRVITDAGAVSCRHVVVALSPMLAGRITWDGFDVPAARLQLSQRMPLAGGFKAFFTYETPFWKQLGLSGQAISTTEPLGSVFDASPPDGSYGALACLTEPELAASLRGMDADRRKEVLLQSVVRYFGPEAAQPAGYFEKYWSADPWSLGAVAFGPPGMWTTCGRALRQSIGPIHFAGTETATKSACNMNGAVDAGLRAAQKILKAGL